MKNHLKRVSPSFVLQNVLIETSNDLLNLLSCTLPFLHAMKFRKLKTHRKIYFSLLSLTITSREGMCILNACLQAYIAHGDHHSL